MAIDIISKKRSDKSSDVNSQQIKCVDSNINVNGIKIRQTPVHQASTAEAANENAGPDVANTQKCNGFRHKINVYKSLVNICLNFNWNYQDKIPFLE